jgi:hypothetical protein
MWALKNRTAYASDRNWIRDKQGVHQWVVAVKATFDIGPGGKLSLCDEQPPPLLAPEYRGDPATSSLRLESDLLAIKRGTDVIVDGCAHASKGRPAPTVSVSLRVGDIDKTLLVHGPRAYYQGAVGITTTNPLPFTIQPIHYEWAFGGTDMSHADPRRHRIDARNPVGKGFAVDPARLERQPAHAIEYPNQNPKKAGPAGLGPICSHWSPRLERGGTYDAGWDKTKKPLLPDDHDERSALAAPDDQVARSPLRGGETVTLINLTPDGARRFELPRIGLAFRTRIGKRTEEHGATLTTVFIDANAARVSLIWQGALRVPARDLEYLDDTTIQENPCPA